MKQSPKLPAEKRRGQLIAAANRVFAAKGYTNATTEEIARVAGLTKGALYFHFNNKEDIFFTVVKEINAVHSRLLLQILEEEKNLEKVIEKALLLSFEHIHKQKYFAVEFWEQVHKIPRIREFLASEHRKLRNVVVCYLLAHSNLKKKECESLFTLMNAVFDGIVIRQSCYRSKRELENAVLQLINMTKVYIRKK